MVGMDFIANAGPDTFSASGSVAERLLDNNLHSCGLRPWVGKDGRKYVKQFLGMKDGKQVFQTLLTNAATLRKDEWISLDKTVVRAARAKLQIWNDLEDAGLGMTVPEGMGKTILQYQAMTDAGNAQLDMDGLGKAERDRTVFDLRGLPLPIAHADFSFSLREVMQSRNYGMPMDTTMAEQETHKIMELIEQLTLGVLPTYSYGGYTIYGFRNYTYRITKTFTLPTAAGWTPDTFVNELLDAIQSLSDIFFLGPYGLYLSPGWSKYLDSDYSAAYGGETLRTRIAKIVDIKWLRKLDYLPNYELLLVQMSSNIVRAVNAMGITPLQWESHAGLQLNFKIMCIKVPMLRANTQLQTGLVHGTAA